MATYKEQWGEAKKLFEKTAKVKKPSAKVDATFRKSPGIDKSLAALDKDLEGIKAIKKALTQNDLDKFKVTLDNFKVVKASYMQILNNTVGAEPEGTDKVAYQKGITVLKTRLDAIETNAVLMSKNAKASLAGLSGNAAVAKNLIRSATAQAAAMEAFLAAQKARPDAAKFNKEILTLARNLNQTIGNVDKLANKGFQFNHAPQPDLFRRLSPWAGGQRKLAATATTQEVEDEVLVVESILRAVKQWLASA